VVVKVPSLTVTVFFARIPRESNEVPDVSETVPVPLAAALKVGAELAELEELDALELDEDAELDAALDDAEVEVEPVELPFSAANALCTADVSCELTRSSAAWLAMLDRPLDRLLEAPNMVEIRLELAVSDWSFCCAWVQ